MLQQAQQLHKLRCYSYRFEKDLSAEVISFEDYKNFGTEAKVKAGKMRIEGKDYIVQDGDVIHFRFNV